MQKVTLSKNIQEIIKDVVENPLQSPLYHVFQETPDWNSVDRKKAQSFNEALRDIQEKQCSAIEFYFRAMTQRLQISSTV